MRRLKELVFRDYQSRRDDPRAQEVGEPIPHIRVSTLQGCAGSILLLRVEATDSLGSGLLGSRTFSGLNSLIIGLELVGPHLKGPSASNESLSDGSSLLTDFQGLQWKTLPTQDSKLPQVKVQPIALAHQACMPCCSLAPGHRLLSSSLAWPPRAAFCRKWATLIPAIRLGSLSTRVQLASTREPGNGLFWRTCRGQAKEHTTSPLDP